MTKRAWTTGELLTKAILDTFLTDLKGEALYGGVVTKTGDYTITDTDGYAIIVGDGSSATVEITLPAAEGTGRIILMTATDVSNAVTVARAGSDVINADITGYTLIAAWAVLILVDIAEGQWLEVYAMQAS